MALAYAFAHSNGIRRKVFDQAMRSYTPEPHRLEKLDTIGKAIFWNDSKATNFSAVLSACKNIWSPLSSKNNKADPRLMQQNSMGGVEVEIKNI